MSARVDKARSAWIDLPDWVEALALACDASSQNKVAQRMGYSPTVISQVLSLTYVGDTDKVETVVRDLYMSKTQTCPALGDISTAGCRDWRRVVEDMREGKTTARDPMRVRMLRACAACPVANPKQGDAS